MGGTFMSMPEDYRGKFIAQLHNALSGFTGTDVDEAVRSVVVRSNADVSWVLIAVTVGILNKANQKQSVSRLRRALIIACDPISGLSARSKNCAKS